MTVKTKAKKQYSDNERMQLKRTIRQYCHFHCVSARTLAKEAGVSYGTAVNLLSTGRKTKDVVRGMSHSTAAAMDKWFKKEPLAKRKEVGRALAKGVIRGEELLTIEEEQAAGGKWPSIVKKSSNDIEAEIMRELKHQKTIAPSSARALAKANSTIERQAKELQAAYEKIQRLEALRNKLIEAIHVLG